MWSKFPINIKAQIISHLSKEETDNLCLINKASYETICHNNNLWNFLIKTQLHCVPESNIPPRKYYYDLLRCVYGYGRNSEFQLGSGTDGPFDNKPIRHMIKQVSSSGVHTAFLTINGDLYMCGANHENQIDSSMETIIKIPKLVKQNVKRVECIIFRSLAYTLILTEKDELYCQGSDPLSSGVKYNMLLIASTVKKFIVDLERFVIILNTGLCLSNLRQNYHIKTKTLKLKTRSVKDSDVRNLIAPEFLPRLRVLHLKYGHGDPSQRIKDLFYSQVDNVIYLLFENGLYLQFNYETRKVHRINDQVDLISGNFWVRPLPMEARGSELVVYLRDENQNDIIGKFDSDVVKLHQVATEEGHVLLYILTRAGNLYVYGTVDKISLPSFADYGNKIEDNFTIEPVLIRDGIVDFDINPAFEVFFFIKHGLASQLGFK